MNMRICLIIVTSLWLQAGLFGNSALAADLPPGISIKDTGLQGFSLKDGTAPFAPLWKGFYVGGNVGGAWGDPGVHDTFVYVGDPSFTGSLNSKSFTGGVQAGYNIQRGSLVFGVEGDIGYLGLSGTKAVSFHPGTCVGTYADGSTVYYAGRICDVDAKYSSSSDLYGDLTLRLGYSFERALFYVKGGAAFLNADFNTKFYGQTCKTLNQCGSGGPSRFDFGHDETLAGWTIGGGVEYALTRSWSLKAEYRHFDFGSMSYSYAGCVSLGGTCTNNNALAGHYTSTINGKTDISLTADAVTVGLNYRFND